MLLEYERDYDFGMDALVTICSWNTNGIMILACMLWYRMLLEYERDYDFGMDVLVIVCSWNSNEIMILAWMLW